MKSKSCSGWTFVEMLVAISLSAIFMGAASLVYSSISKNSKRLTNLVELDIGASNAMNFYDQGSSTVRVYSAPNFGKAALAQEIRDLMLEDAQYSSSVFCLPRSLNNTVRAEFLAYPAGSDPGLPRPRLDTPEAFRQFLAQIEPTSAGIYDLPIRNVPPTNRPNTTIFLLAPDENPEWIRLRAVYEIDLIAPNGKAGAYASVRRYRNDALTHYYDVYYEPGSGTPFHPAFVCFERSARLAVNEGAAIDRFKVSPGGPFTFVWLPDPAINPFAVPTAAPGSPATSARHAYEHMGDKSSLLVVLPMFPGL